MLRLATIFAVLVAVSAYAAVAAPPVASAAGCEVISDVRDRADCHARAEARAAAQAEVERRTSDAGAAAADGARSGRSAAWERALEESSGIHLDELVDARLLAAIGGLAWFALAWRAQRRRDRPRRRAG